MELANLSVPTLLFMKVQRNGSFSDGTGIVGQLDHPTAGMIDADKENEAVNPELYFIVPEKCTGACWDSRGAQCAAVCPVDCCVPDEDNEETEDVLLAKKDFMHL